MFKKSTAVMLLFSLTAVTAHAGGLLTNTNQNISFNRNFAREGTIGIDGVYSNPAGVSFLTEGIPPLAQRAERISDPRYHLVDNRADAPGHAILSAVQTQWWRRQR